tara:strand:- start:136 stop:744 length:609 start_codon:yes stop_codon:yes gene_type:complete
MEQLSDEIHNLTISTGKNFIQKFSQMNLKKLNLEDDHNILVGHLIFHTNVYNVTNLKKKYFLALTTYFTEKKNNMIYPLSSNLILVKKTSLNKPLKYFNKILKEKYSFTKSNIENVTIFEVYNKDGIIIYGINIPILKKKVKELKNTRIIHLYKDPYTTHSLKELYIQVLSNHMNSLDRRFYFFYNNIKITIKEKLFLEKLL